MKQTEDYKLAFSTSQERNLPNFTVADHNQHSLIH
jgi:hypothetical protein